MSTLASTFAAIVAAPLPTQDRVEIAEFLLRTGLVGTANLLLDRAISRAA